MPDHINHIPLSALRASTRNVRRSKDGVQDLAANIHSVGLLQPPTVFPQQDGTYTVIAGDRRWRALLLLQEQGKLPADATIPCTILDPDLHDDMAISEISLSENVMRQQMHPADEFDAFSKLVEEGRSIAEIADRFGQSEIHVRRRLKLANVAPEIMQDYRAGEATLEQLMALSATDDHETQVRIWNTAEMDWERDPDRLREAVTAKEISENSRLGKFVGMKAYSEAGGPVRQDLFDSEQGDLLTDPELVRKLAQEKLERTAAKMEKEGWKWVEARVDFDYSAEAKFGRIYPDWEGNKQVWPDEAKKTAGVVVTVGYNGQTECKRGLIRPEDMREAKADGKVSGGKTPRAAGELSFSAVQRLQAEAGVIVQNHVASEPRIALALLAAQLPKAAIDLFPAGWLPPALREKAKKRIRARTERLILGVNVDCAGDAAIKDATRTHQLINELLEEGYTEAYLAHRLGYSTPRLQFGKKISTRNAYRVEILHKELTT